ncbi:uncharacterized protein BcabD6B2_51520 [Babesia caballi]|uniref:Uncharacterized protein n=1 Tax=Babesia caballi TaxID=5871 RepID=A0AAV4M0X0_BABCB|nr:hypothetical protein BcabD6B2_51520 [Babesia caballi]
MDRGLGYIPGGKPGGWTAPTAGDLPYLKGYHGSLPKPLHTSNWKHEADTDPLAKAAEYPEKHIDATAQNGPIKVKSLDLDVTGDIWNNDRGGQFRPIGANQAELPDAIPAAHSIVNIQSHAEGGVDANGRKDINRTRVKNFVRKPSSTVHNNKQSTHSTAVTIPKEARKSVRARKSLQTDKVAAVISETSRRSVTDENDDISSSIEPDEYEEAMTRSSTGVLIAGGFFSSVLLITGGLVVYLKRKE